MNKVTIRLEQFYRNDLGVTKWLVKSLKKLSLKDLLLGSSLLTNKQIQVQF